MFTTQAASGEMPPGTNLSVKWPVLTAQVRKSGIMCSFRSPDGQEFLRMVPASPSEYLSWLDGLEPELAMPNIGEKLWATFTDGYPRRV